MQDFVHLHVHSQYSILDGQASIQKLVDKAIGDGMRGIAITDHGNMFGIKEFWNYVKKKNGARRDKVKQTSAAVAELRQTTRLPYRALAASVVQSISVLPVSI